MILSEIRVSRFRKKALRILDKQHTFEQQHELLPIATSLQALIRVLPQPLHSLYVEDQVQEVLLTCVQNCAMSKTQLEQLGQLSPEATCRELDSHLRFIGTTPSFRAERFRVEILCCLHKLHFREEHRRLTIAWCFQYLHSYLKHRDSLNVEATILFLTTTLSILWYYVKKE